MTATKKQREAEIRESQAGWRPEPALYSKAQAAAYLNISVRSITSLLKRKELVRRKVGSRTLIPKTSLESFLKKDHATQ